MGKRAEMAAGEGHNSGEVITDTKRVLFFMNRSDYHEGRSRRQDAGHGLRRYAAELIAGHDSDDDGETKTVNDPFADPDQQDGE